ncbi:MAG: type I-G CRISPR-associated helicase/endonuclease Cas3g [Actinomycetes bacterium]
MSLDRGDFADFFRELHGGYKPFAWQERLLDYVLTDGRWPSQVVAPTGAGKTSVIDIHVFAQALVAAGRAPRLPRRLAMVVDRRVLVDDQHEYARLLAQRLALQRGDCTSGVLGEVASLLWRLRLPDAARRTQAVAVEDLSPLVVGRLRGGSPPSRIWRDHPTAASVLCATPDMWGSRLLFRGYGSSTLAWPREAGLLAIDSVVVVDEAHLARQLLVTARRVEQLARVAEQTTPWIALQVVEATATPPRMTGGVTARGAAAVGVEEVDLPRDPLLAMRLTRPKPVRLLGVKDWDNAGRTSRAVPALADAVVDVLAAAPPTIGVAGTVGCFVNTVGRAVAVAAELRRRKVSGRALRVVLVCGQLRPLDLDRVRARNPGLLGLAGNEDIDVLVSTQSLEVGVDLDLAGMVTELASGSALAQRAGRLNRRGLRETAPVVVVVPDTPSPDGDGVGGADPSTVVSDRTRSGPYGAAELRGALVWLRGRADDPAGLAPWQLRGDPPPAAATRRALFQRPELADAWHWARTSDDLAAEPELDLWLAEDLTADTSVGFVVRDRVPVDTADAIRLISNLPPRRHEVFSVPYRTALAALCALRGEPTTPGGGLSDSPAIIRVRGEDTGLLGWRDKEPSLRPGDVIVLDTTAELFTSSADDAGFSPPVVVGADEDAPGPVRARADDVLQAQADLPRKVWETYQVGGVVLRIEPGCGFLPAEADLAGLANSLIPPGEPVSDDEQHEALRDWLDRYSHATSAPGMLQAAADLLGEPTTRSELTIHQDTDGRLVRVLLVDRRRAAADEGIRQVWTPEGLLVTLAAHQQAVADRAALLAEHLGLGSELVAALRLGGAHHDDGKQDARFQVRLGARDDTVLAKSRSGTTAEARRRNNKRSGLSGDWRHEQRSVAESWDSIREARPCDPLLVARLVGTSHGHGRSGFPHTADGLLLPGDNDGLRKTARDLFDLGGWDDLVETTQQRYGVWGCAYLEAVLRAADGQVSEEGS